MVDAGRFVLRKGRRSGLLRSLHLNLLACPGKHAEERATDPTTGPRQEQGQVRNTCGIISRSPMVFMMLTRTQKEWRSAIARAHDAFPPANPKLESTRDSLGACG